jgi:molybdopterin-synthase adenylyltransferase
VTTPFLHEAFYRGPEALERLGGSRVAICGAGALGSHLADNLVRQGLRRLTVIDYDRVEAHNIGTQLYELDDVGAPKVDVLRARCFRAAGVEIDAVATRLTQHNAAKLLRGAALVCDTLDNAASRRILAEYCTQQSLPCLHLGMNGGYGEMHWNDGYRVPNDVALADPCAYPLARNLVLLVVALGSEAIVRALLEGRRDNYSCTLRDLAVNRDE